MKIDKTDNIYQNPYYIKRINEIRNHFINLLNNEQVNVTLWKVDPRNGRNIAASKAIKYLVEVIGTNNEISFSHVFFYPDAFKYKIKTDVKSGYIGENQIINALKIVGIKPNDIYVQYKFHDDPIFMKSNCKFDVYVKSLNAIIEHHGTQHTKQSDFFVHNNMTAEIGFKNLQSYDLQKRDYCIKRNIRYFQFSIYDFPSTYMGLPVYKKINDLLSVLGLRTLTDYELSKVITDSRTVDLTGINKERLILEWNSKRFVLTTQDDAARILDINAQTIFRWRENNDNEFKFYYDFTSEEINIPDVNDLRVIKSRINQIKNPLNNRNTTGCEFVVIYEDKNKLHTIFLSGYESCIECEKIPIKYRVSKNVLRVMINRNSSEIAIQYGLMRKYKMGCLFLKTDVFNKIINQKTIRQLYDESGNEITKGKMPKVVCYDKNNIQKHIVCINATNASLKMKELGIGVASASIENACFYLDHKITNIEPWRFCFLCEFEDKGKQLELTQENNKANSVRDVVLFWNNIPVAHGGIRKAERVLNIYRALIMKQLKTNKKSQLKGICDFKDYTVEEYGLLPDFSEWSELNKFKQEYQSNRF